MGKNKSDLKVIVSLSMFVTWLVQAGPGTIAEAMIRGLPIILNGYIAGQVSSTLKTSHLYVGSGFQL